MELTPETIEHILRGVVHAGLRLGNDEVAFAYPGRRRFPLFRQEQRRPRKAAVELADDCRKLVASRAKTARTSDGKPLTADILAEFEDALTQRDTDYVPGHFLSLVRLSLDLADTTLTGITAVERRSFHQIGRRLREMQSSERPVHPELSTALLSLLVENDPVRLRGVADLLRYLDEVTLHPLLGWPQYSATDAMHLFLHLVHVAEHARIRRPQAKITPLDACLGARAVLANSRVLHLRVGALLDTVLPQETERRAELDAWLDEVDHKETDGTLPLSEMGRDPTFRIESTRIAPLDLVLRTAKRLLTSSRRPPVNDTLTALERTIYRKVYRQEGHKHQAVVLLRRNFDRVLQSRNRRAMRMGSSTSKLAMISTIADPMPRQWSLETWAPILAKAELLERARANAWTPTGSQAIDLLYAPGEARPETLLPDGEEFLRWSLDCRGDLREALVRQTEERRENLARWLQRLFVRCAEHDAQRHASRPPGWRATHPWSPTTPLQWFTAARETSRRGPEPRRWDPRQHDPDELLLPLDEQVKAILQDWQQRMPWEQRQFGIWPLDLRGDALRQGLRPGVLNAQEKDVWPTPVAVRLDLLERELEFRSWLGARERVRLFESTMLPIEED